MGNRTRKTAQEKQRIVEESKILGLVETARKHEISYQSLRNWAEAYAISGLDGLSLGAKKVSPELKRLQIENQRLKELVADKELELMIKNELLKKTSSIKQTGK
jgi:putative transposase